MLVTSSPAAELRSAAGTCCRKNCGHLPRADLYSACPGLSDASSHCGVPRSRAWNMCTMHRLRDSGLSPALLRRLQLHVSCCIGVHRERERERPRSTAFLYTLRRSQLLSVQYMPTPNPELVENAKTAGFRQTSNSGRGRASSLAGGVCAFSLSLSLSLP